MGQYYIVVNVDKKEYMKPESGVKLMEWSYNRNPLVLNLLKNLAGRWKGDNVFVVGDYAISNDRIYEDKGMVEKGYDYDVLDKIEKKLGIKDKKINGYNVSLYGLAYDEFKEIKLEKLEEEYRYIYNHNKKEYIDLNHCPLAWFYKEKNKYNEVKIAPISLLLTLGNGMGGGDYWGNNYNNVGRYIEDVEKLEITKELLDLDYKEYRPEFYEGIYIPYNEISNAINIEDQKEQITKEIVEFLSESDNEYFKNLYNDKKTAMDRINFSLEYEAGRKKIEINDIISNSSKEIVKEKGTALIRLIEEYEIKKAVLSNKCKSEVELKNENYEDRYINETYKRIFDDLKLNNIIEVKTINKETTVTFETEEKSTIRTNNKNELKDYIENTKNINQTSKEQKKVIKYTEINERVSKNDREPRLFYYECRENGGEKVIEKSVWVDYVGTLVTNKDILGEKEFINYNELFENPELMLMDDSDIEERVINKIEKENEEEEIQ